jgi:predicted nucleic acid-binding protein
MARYAFEQESRIVPVVVDTDVLSFLYKRDTSARLYEPHLNDPPFIVSFMSLAELRRWALERSWGESRRQELEDYLTRYLILHSDDHMFGKWAEAMNSARKGGRPVAPADAWIAATALLLDVPLVTHNGNHYEGIEGLRVICEV